MSKRTYQAKPVDDTRCKVVFPATQMSKATKASFKSLRMQIEQRFSSEAIVGIELDKLANMDRITLSLMNEQPSDLTECADNQILSGVIAKEMIKQIKDVEAWISKHRDDKIILNFSDGVITLNNEKVVKQTLKTVERQERLLLIDGSNVLTTAYYATRRNMLKNEDGLYTNAVFVMAKKLLDLISRSQSTHLAIAWDKGRETFRRAMYSEYKAHRKATEPELKQQFETAQSLFKQLGFAQYAHEEIEADDVIGTIAKRWESEMTGPCLIISNDKDLHQLITGRVNQLVSRSQNEQRINLETMKEEYGVEPGQWADCKALLGDSSDNIPGVAGVGEKAAYPLIAEYGNLETLYNRLGELQESKKFKRYFKNLSEGRDAAFLSKKLAEIRCDADELINANLSEMEVSVNRSKMISAFRQLGFKSLIYSLEKGVYKVG